MWILLVLVLVDDGSERRIQITDPWETKEICEAKAKELTDKIVTIPRVQAVVTKCVQAGDPV
jgi:hypothetical protein